MLLCQLDLDYNDSTFVIQDRKKTNHHYLHKKRYNRASSCINCTPGQQQDLYRISESRPKRQTQLYLWLRGQQQFKISCILIFIIL